MRVDDLIDLMWASDADQIRLKADEAPMMFFGSHVSPVIEEAVTRDDFAEMQQALRAADRSWRPGEPFASGTWIVDGGDEQGEFGFVVGCDGITIRSEDDSAVAQRNAEWKAGSGASQERLDPFEQAGIAPDLSNVLPLPGRRSRRPGAE